MKLRHNALAVLLLTAAPAAVLNAQVNSRESNALTFQVNDTEYARISDTSGNVGIGTTNPVAKLTVAGNVSVTGMIDVGHAAQACATAISGSIRFESVSDTLQICTSAGWKSLTSASTVGNATVASSTGAIQFNSGGQLAGDTSNLFWDDANNRLGIGTTSPGQTLDVIGNIRSSSNATDATTKAQYFSTAHFTNAEEDMLNMSSVSGNGFNSIQIGGGNASYNAATALQFYTGGTATTTTGTERLRIDSTGNVGIGTTAPGGVLHTSGSLAIMETGTNRKATFQTLSALNNVTDDTTYGPSIGFSRETDGANNIAGLGLYNANNLFVGAYSDIVFGSGAVSTFNNAYERMRIASNGNIGIGTTSPNAKLHISDTAVGNNGPFLQLSSGYSGGYSSGELLFDSYHSSGHDFAVGHGWNAESFSIRDLTASGSPYRVILDGSGNVGIGRAPRTLLDAGTTGSTEQAYLPGSVNIQDWNGSDAAYLNAYDGAGGNMTLMLRTTSTGSVRDAAFFAAAGNMTVYGASTNCVIGSGSGATNCTSDARLKTDIKPIASALEKIASLDGVTFHWKDPEKPQREFVGVIAQNVEKVFPQVVDTVSDTTLGIAKTVDYAALVAPLIEAIKELKTKNDSQAAELKALREELRVHTSEHH